MMGPILVAGEDNSKRVELSSMLRALGYRVIEAESGLRTLDLLRRRRNIALAIIDISMSDLGVGVADLITTIRTAGVATAIIVVSGQEDEQVLQKAIKAGAVDYLLYPISSTRLGVTLGNLAMSHTLEREIHFIRRFSENHLRFSDMFAKSEAMQQVLKQAEIAALSNENLLIEGEMGTGRETMARIIHHESSFSKGPFIRIQCFGLSSFTQGETEWKREFLRLLETGKDGTICLCDVDRLEPVLQKYLANFLRKRLAKNGDKPDFRLMVISLSHLKYLAEDGFFDLELFGQLSQLCVKVPALRARRDDLPDVIQRAVDHIVVESGQAHVHGLSGSAISLLMQYDWPGNVSELENMLFRAVLLSKGPLLMIHDFPQLIGNKFVDFDNENYTDINQSKQALAITFLDEDGHVRTFSKLERDIIERAIMHYDGHISEVARRLQIGRSTLYRKLDEYQEKTEPELKKHYYG